MSTKRYLTRHRNVRRDERTGKQRDKCTGHSNSRTRSIFLRRPSRQVQMDVDILGLEGIDTPRIRQPHVVRMPLYPAERYLRAFLDYLHEL